MNVIESRVTSITEVVQLLNEMIEAREHLLAAFGSHLEMVFDNGYVHDCANPIVNNVHFRGKIEAVREGNVIPLRRGRR